MEKGKLFPAFSQSVFNEDRVDSLKWGNSMPAFNALFRVAMASSSSFFDPA